MTFRLIDTHGHLNLPPLVETWEAVCDRSLARKIAAIVLPGTDLATSKQGLALARARPGQLFAGVGLHPTYLGNQQSEVRDQHGGIIDYDKYLQLARLPEVVAIGEVGLDTYRSADNLDEQEKVLREFIQIAQEVKKPLILHCRGRKKPEVRPLTSDLRSPNHDPHERLIRMLTDRPADQRPAFVVHCYQGTAAQAKRYLALGGCISFTGTITYSDDPAVAAAIAAVPLAQLMIETDSPFLAPVPYRGQVNEPWKVVEVARRIAAIKQRSLAAVAAATTRTAIDFFQLPVPG